MRRSWRQVATWARSTTRSWLSVLAAERGPGAGGRWPSSARAWPTRARTCAGGPTSAPCTAIFLSSLFTPPDALGDKLGDLDPALVTAYLDALIAGYRDSDDPAAWFDLIRTLAAAHAASPCGRAAQVVRVALTGSTRSPDLYAVARCLGRDEVVRRLRERVGRGRPRGYDPGVTEPIPPHADPRRFERVHHGDTVVDEYGVACPTRDDPGDARLPDGPRTPRH